MSDYIKRNVALDAMRDVMKQAKHLRPPLYDAIDNVKNLPSADVVEVRHGHWTVKHPEYMRLDRSTDVMECSECGHRILRRTGEIANYCPNCGAKMI